MNKFIFIIGCILLISCTSKNTSNSEKVNSVQNESKKLSEFEFNEEMHNFGTLQSGEILVYSFPFINTGKENLKINDVETDCGCLKVKFSEKPVLPGEKGYIEVEFDSSGLIGRQFKTIEVHANIKKPKQLAIFANVENEQLEIKY